MGGFKTECNCRVLIRSLLIYLMWTGFLEKADSEDVTRTRSQGSVSKREKVDLRIG